ncbi:MAG: DUF222 domain-containing protein [Pseudonocardia sp.]
MISEPLACAAELGEQLLARLAAGTGSRASEQELLAALRVCEGIARGVERMTVGAIADLQRSGAFASRGYHSAVKALTDLLGWDRADARRRVLAAEQAVARIGLDGGALPARLPATAAAYAAGGCGLRQVEVIAKVLAGPSARRLAPDVWADAEAQLAAIAGDFAPADLHSVASALVERLDADGPEPDDRPPAQVNEVFLARNPNGGGGRIKGRIDDPAMYDAIATVIDATAEPVDADDDRPTGQRQAEALADACGYVLDHGPVPERGGERPHLNVIVRLEDLENRARAGCLDLGGQLPADTLRMLCCDARVVPIVLEGAGQPLDVGRATRVVPDGLRRAIAARDRGRARCGRPPSWCEIHHLVAWEHDGETSLTNCAMSCRSCHRLVHHGGWDVRMRLGIPEFLPPPWIDPQRRPRQRPAHLRPAAA